MTDPKQIPHLIKLLDDDSQEVKTRIIKELTAFGPTLRDEVRKVPFPLNNVQQLHIDEIFNFQKKIYLKQYWHSWYNLKTEYDKLERALTVLSDFLTDFESDLRLGVLLDSLAYGYKQNYDVKDPFLLARFLFKEKGLSGNEKDYYNPQNCNLVYVIQEKKGIPISLAAVYMLVGVRLGLTIEGCHFPGHFLARILQDGKRTFIDCFNNGQMIEEEDILRAKEDVLDGLEDILSEDVAADTIVRRFLANLIRAFEIIEDNDNSQVIIGLFKEFDKWVEGKSAVELTPEYIIKTGKQSFKQGQLVRHKRYGYRGIVVDVDDQCAAADTWYYGNQTQPTRNQAWYHVLVDGSDQVTYVAETNLVSDNSAKKIDHPLISYFFNQTIDGKYIRNENPWPETEL